MAARAGVTLVELLIVLAILGIVATLVVPGTASVFRVGQTHNGTTAAVADSARRLAVSRGVTVRLQVFADGHWRVLVPGADEPLATGVLPDRVGASDMTDVLVDPLGTCRPAPGSHAATPDTRSVFDAGLCRWVREEAMMDGTPP